MGDSAGPVNPAPKISRRRGKLITLEGGEGAGKSTQQKLILQRLEAAGIEAIGTREPGGSPMAEEMREILLAGTAAPLGTLAEAMLFAAARIDHIDSKIGPALEQGIWVISDRFSDSTRAYQGAQGKVPMHLIRMLERVTLAGMLPDLTLILDLPPETGLARAAARRGKHERTDRFEGEEMAFHHALHASFRQIATSEPQRCALIDATGDAGEIAAQIWHQISGRLMNARMRARARGIMLAPGSNNGAGL